MLKYSLIFGLLLGCDTGPQTGEQASTLSCIQGWWVSSSSGHCSACSVAPNSNPECAQPDCQQFAFSGFTRDNLMTDGVLMYSATSKTISSVGPVARRGFVVNEQNKSVEPVGSKGVYTCTGEELRGAYSYDIRAPANIAVALANSTATGTLFRGVSVAQ